MIVLTRVTDLGNDVIEVEGYDQARPGELLIAHGWVSAMNNHFDPDAYAPDGHLSQDASSRAMTMEEQRAYWRSLLAKPGHEQLFEDRNALSKHTASKEAAIGTLATSSDVDASVTEQ